MLYYLFVGLSLFAASSAAFTYGLFAHWYWWLQALLVAVLVFGLCVLAHLLFCVFLAFFVHPDKPVTKQSRLFYRVLVETAYLFLRVLNVHVHLEGKEKLPENCRFLLVCNHISWIDPAISIVLLQKYHIAFISRKENYSYPLAKQFLYKTACLAIDRDNNREALKTINQAAEFLKSGECAIGIYPEGWITKTGEIQEFRHGAFRIAKKGEAPIVVATISGADKALKKTLWKRCDVTLTIRDVIPADYVAAHKTAEISDFAREIMMKK